MHLNFLRPLSIICLSSIFFLGLILTQSAAADSAKQKYLYADSCYKKLRQSSTKKKLASEWLSCIKKYENIYKSHPSSSWAPAGMYKASELYITLSKLSGKSVYRTQAVDLLTRIRKRYPQSAYSGRAGSLLKELNVTQVTQVTQATQVKRTSPPNSNGSIRTIHSKKEETKNAALMKAYYRSLNPKPKPAAAHQTTTEQTTAEQTTAEQAAAPDQKPVIPVVSPKPEPTEDTMVTDLRFWSNPEYTRIVVNAEGERAFSHRLLKKDPDIDKPFQRLYIDIEQARLGQKVAEHTPINDNLLKQARAGQYLPHTVRVVVDIKSFENYKIFSLRDPFRIVIDVWGKGSNGSPVKKPGQEMAATTQPGKDEKTTQITTDNLKSSDIARQLALGVRKIVIDPGHGGADPGAPGYFKNVWEKDIVLKLAKKLAATLRDRLQCTVLLTRSSDIKLTLEERTAIANTQRADLFISLHCNAARNRKLKGIETYILNLATDDQAIAVAARENATSEKNISDLEYILSDLMKHAKIEESTRLANVVHSSFVTGMKAKYSSINDLGVKQAPFYVLLGARMPSILIETSFISNKVECKRLLTDAYQTQICKSITDGVEKYINATNPQQL
jgi:N-acetylmuramoyl-L-alanine amidase